MPFGSKLLGLHITEAVGSPPTRNTLHELVKNTDEIGSETVVLRSSRA